jgi:hypothetical protein
MLQDLMLAITAIMPLAYLCMVYRAERDEALAIELAKRRGDEIRRAYQSGFRFGLEEGEYRAKKMLNPPYYTIGEWFFALRDGRTALRLK